MLRTKIYQLLLGISVICLLGACAGSTVVDFKVELEVDYLDAQRQPIDTSSAQLTESARVPTRLSPYPLVNYRDGLLSYHISVSTHGITFYYLENLSAKPLTIYWDQAQASSGQYPAPRPLHSVFSMTDYRGNQLVPQLLEQGIETYARINVIYGELFESGRLFDVQFVDGKTRLDKTGVGEWLLIKLPIDLGDERLMLHIKLTALDASARISYF